jgi:hypothetical protein
VQLNKEILTVISGVRRDIDEICVLLTYYAALIGSSVPTFRINLSVSSSRVKKSKKISSALKVKPVPCRGIFLKEYHSTLRSIPEDRRSQ